MKKEKKGRLKFLKGLVDFQDFLLLISLSMIFYGFYIWKPFLSFIVVGFILLYIVSGFNNNEDNKNIRKK